MNTGKSYKFVLYNGITSRIVSGKLICIIAADQLHRFNYDATSLSTDMHHLLPNGTPFSEMYKEWYITEMTDGSTIPICSSWVKDDGITEYDSSELVLSGSFESGRTLDYISAAFVNAKIYDVSFYQELDEGEVVETLEPDVRYSLSLSDTAGSKLQGLYIATTGYSALPAFELHYQNEYGSYDWPEDLKASLTTGKWYIFASISDTGTKFAVHEDWIDGDISTLSNQTKYQFSKVGTEDDVTALRSQFNILGCTSVVIGTNS